jgi:polyhydroxyalkanoate synthesis regulator phasin
MDPPTYIFLSLETSTRMFGGRLWEIRKYGGGSMDIIRKAIFLGLGAIAMTQDKAESIVDELIKKGEIASSERYKTIDRLLREADNQQKQVQDRLSETVEKAILKMGLPTKRDLDEIKDTLKRIELKLTITENKTI